MSVAADIYDAEPIPGEAQAEINRLLETGDLFRYTSPDDSPVALLEKEFAATLGSRYALAVSSCSAALFLSLRALDLAPGAHVLIPAFTFAAVPSAVVHANCIPVLVESKSNFRIDLDDFESKLSDNIAAVMISHMRGHTSDMDAVMSLANTYDIPVIEDAAHSLGSKWNGRNIGTIGKIGCFSFQSYKLLNAGEGGILVTNDSEIIARAVIMSGAYEHNWKRHPVLHDCFAKWQNKLPLYNTRLSNLSAAVIRPQLAEIPRRVRNGKRNHDFVASRLNESRWLHVPSPLAAESRAPDSIQFNLLEFSDAESLAFQNKAERTGVKVQIFGMTADNARAYWNWRFLRDLPHLPQTTEMLARACDVRLPARLTLSDCVTVASALTDAAEDIKAQNLITKG